MNKAILPLAAAMCLACGTSGTGEEEVPFTLAFAGDPDACRFTNERGWTIELEEARVAVGQLTLVDGEPPTARLLDRALRLLVPVAHAHAGFDEWDGGRVRGELLEAVAIDALADEAHPPIDLVGVAGEVRSAVLELAPTSAASLQGYVARVRGTATRDGETVAFEGGLDLGDDPKGRRIAGVPAALTLREGARVILRVHPRRWLRGADFSTLEAPAAPGELRRIQPGTQVHGAFFVGVRSHGAFTLEARD